MQKHCHVCHTIISTSLGNVRREFPGNRFENSLRGIVCTVEYPHAIQKLPDNQGETYLLWHNSLETACKKGVVAASWTAGMHEGSKKILER